MFILYFSDLNKWYLTLCGMYLFYFNKYYLICSCLESLLTVEEVSCAEYAAEGSSTRWIDRVHWTNRIREDHVHQWLFTGSLSTGCKLFATAHCYQRQDDVCFLALQIMVVAQFSCEFSVKFNVLWKIHIFRAVWYLEWLLSVQSSLKMCCTIRNLNFFVFKQLWCRKLWHEKPAKVGLSWNYYSDTTEICCSWFCW